MSKETDTNYKLQKMLSGLKKKKPKGHRDREWGLLRAVRSRQPSLIGDFETRPKRKVRRRGGRSDGVKLE